jgi:hypothetical protein
MFDVHRQSRNSEGVRPRILGMPRASVQLLKLSTKCHGGTLVLDQGGRQLLWLVVVRIK